ncbi:MAG: hypothetical protein GYA31_01565 [Parcubacteria group bacterium]|nr:hypothetical protein [Parcubacteria group bacterium]
MNDEELEKLEKEINDSIEQTSGQRPSMGTVECVLRKKDLHTFYCEGCYSQLSCKKRVAIYYILSHPKSNFFKTNGIVGYLQRSEKFTSITEIRYILVNPKSQTFEAESIEEYLKKSDRINSAIKKVLVARNIEEIEKIEHEY